jgi:DeoR family transcriptional regulator, aga operon transcriptional repressor
MDPTAPAEVRQERITALVEEQGFVRVGDLAARFGVSTVTVRTDLQSLESHGRLRRIRGGAMPAGMLRSERPFEIAEQDLAGEKAAIGAHAAGLVAEGDTVLLDVGTTTVAIARALVARSDLSEVTVVTSGLRVALELERARPRISVVVTGRTLRPLQHSLVNPLGTVMLERLNAATAFIGCNGVDVRGGVTNINLPRPRSSARCCLPPAARSWWPTAPSSARSRWPRSATGRGEHGRDRCERRPGGRRRLARRAGGRLGAAVLGDEPVDGIGAVGPRRVDLDEVAVLGRDALSGGDRVDRADRLAQRAVDALAGVDDEHLVDLVDAVDRADVEAREVLDPDARRADDVGHAAARAPAGCR